MQLRYIYLGEIPLKYSWAIWEYPIRSYFNIDTPTVFVHSPSDSGIDMGTHEDLSLYLQLDKLPSDWVVTRGYTPNSTHYGVGGPLFVNKDVMFFNLHYPSNLNQSRIDLELSTIKVLRTHGVRCLAERGNNLLFEDKDGKLRKFSGSLHQDWGNGWFSRNTFMSYSIDYNLCDSIIDFSKNTKWSKNKISSLKDIAGGLFEVDDSLQKDIISKQIIEEFARRRDFEFIEYTLPIDHLNKLGEIGDDLLSNEWIYNLKHPKFGEQ